MDPAVAAALEKQTKKRTIRDGVSNTQAVGGGSSSLTDIKFAVHYKNNTETLRKRFTGNDKVLDLRTAIMDEITGHIDSSNSRGSKKQLRVVYERSYLDDDNVLLSNVPGIRGDGNENPTLHVVYKVIGGSQAQDEKEYKYNSNNNNNTRERLADFQNEKRIVPTFEPDCIFGYNDKINLRVKMPCGHVFAPNTMYELIKMYVNNPTKSDIRCPILKCDKIWLFSIAAAAGDLDETDRRNFSNILSRRSLLHSGNFKECRHCKALVSKPDDLKKIRVRCTCENSRDFCWTCGQDWKGGGWTVCGNKDCNTIKINDLLKTCQPVTVDGISCPEFRVCPRCLTLVGWQSNCKHMRCWGCNKEFCYVCLCKRNDNGGFPCSSSSVKCIIAPRQELK